MSVLAIKTTIVASITGGSILGIYGVHRYIEKIGVVNVEQSLTNSEKKRLLDTTKYENAESSHDYQNWKAIVENSSTLEKLKEFISQNNTEISKENTIDKLIDKCQKSKGILSSKDEFPKVFSNFKKFCLRKN